MSRTFFCLILLLALCLIIISGCATPLPSTYNISDDSDVVDGPILALAGEGDIVVAANDNGLFMKKGDAPWKQHEVPGISDFGKITCLGVNQGVIYLGSDGEGLHIFSNGMWEVKTSRYGGLPDDGVLSLAFDGADEGLPGVSLWVGTRKGIANQKNGEWTVYKPESGWLVAMTGKTGLGAGKVFVGPGFSLGAKGDDSSKFRPPVSAISVGPDQVVFGNRNSNLAVVSENAVAVLLFGRDRSFTALVVTKNVIWAGTETGLLWGGLKGLAEGKPWPTQRIYDSWKATLFGSRNSQPFEYRWKLLGYNNAHVAGLVNNGGDLWTAYRSRENPQVNSRKRIDSTDESENENPISGIRLFMNIDEYIARRQTPQYESYGVGSGIKGKPSALYVSQDGLRVLVGTTKGLWELQNN